MFTRIPSAPPSYSPGYFAFPPVKAVAHTNTFEGGSLLSEPIDSHSEKLQTEHNEFQRDGETQARTDEGWHQVEEARRARLAKLKEEAIKAQIEWERMGGSVRDTGPADAEFRRKLDAYASLTKEERGYKVAWDEYDKAWDRLATSVRPTKKFTFRKLAFAFADIPWPVLCDSPDESPRNRGVIRIEDITSSSVARFLLHPLRDPQKSRRDKLREAILRYHPDKFEGRILPRILAEDRDRVQEAVGAVMKCLNELMSAEA